MATSLDRQDLATAGAPAPVGALLADLGRVDRRLRQQVERLRAEGLAPTDDQFRGLYVSDTEVDAILEGQWPLDPVAGDVPDGELRLTYPPLRALTERFELDTFDVEALLICLAP